MKYFYLVIPDRIPVPCFSCGKKMTFVRGEKTRECRDCEVTELRFLGEYTIMCRKYTSCTWYGEEIQFADHSRVHWPVP